MRDVLVLQQFGGCRNGPSRRTLTQFKDERAEMQNTSQTIDRLFVIYCQRFGEWNRSQEPMRVRLHGSNRFPRLNALSKEEFQRWLLDDWRTPVLKRDWLETFLDLSVEGLDCLSTTDRMLVQSIAENLPRTVRIAS